MGALMADKKKKMAAALAAVSLYLQQEEAALCEQQAPGPETGGAAYSPWAQSGSQEMMTMRKLIQLRTFTRF